MKKFFLAMVTAFCAVLALRADDVEDIQTLIRKSSEDAAARNVAGAFSCFTEDCIVTDQAGNSVPAERIRMLATVLDGKHPTEFLLFTVRLDGGAADLTEEQLEQLKAVAETEEFQKTYREACEMFYSLLVKAAELELKSIRFLSVTVDGDTAVAVYEEQVYVSPDSDQVATETVTNKLKKVDGRWMIFEQSTTRK